MKTPEEIQNHLHRLMIRLYNAGYKAGHHYTVEGGYVDVFDCDRYTYHEEEVMEIIDDELKGEQ